MTQTTSTQAGAKAQATEAADANEPLKAFFSGLGNRLKAAGIMAVGGTIVTIIATWAAGRVPQVLTWIPSDNFRDSLARQVETDPKLQGKKVSVVEVATVEENAKILGIGPEGIKAEYSSRLYPALRAAVVAAQPDSAIVMNQNEQKLFTEGLRAENLTKFKAEYGSDIRSVVGWGGGLVTTGLVALQFLSLRRRERD